MSQITLLIRSASRVFVHFVSAQEIGSIYKQKQMNVNV